MERRRAYVERMKVKLDQWDAEIDRLQAEMRGTHSRVRQEQMERVAALKSKAAKARKTLEQIRNAGASAWESLVAGANQIWDDLRETLRETKAALGEAVESDAPSAGLEERTRNG